MIFPIHYCILPGKTPSLLIYVPTDPTSTLSKALRLGMNPATIRAGSKFLGLPGLALSLGYEGYDQYKKYTEGRGFVYNLLNKDE